MLNMKEKALLGLAIALMIALAATIVVAPWFQEVKLLTNPNGSKIYVPVNKPFNVSCQGSAEDRSKFSSMKWLNTKGDAIPEGIPGVLKGEKNSLILAFTKPKIDDSGLYKCTAVYDNKYDFEIDVKIIFYGGKPTFEYLFENITAEEGSSLDVKCSALGDKPIKYKWFTQNEDEVREDKNLPIFVSNSEDWSSLTIQNVQSNHKGIYTCTASNEHGLTSKLYRLDVVTESSKETDDGTQSITGVKVLNITESSVHFYVVTNGSVISIEVKFSESRNTTEYSLTHNPSGDFKITDLIPGGLYNFQFRTVLPETGNWTKVYQVTLLPDIPEAIFQNLESRSIKLEWFRKFDDIIRGTIDKYEISYFTVEIDRGNTWIPSKCAITIQIPTCTGSGYTISGLQSNAYYEIQLRAHTVSGYSQPYRQKIIFRT